MSNRSSKEIHLDSDYVATGAHDGVDGTKTLRKMGAEFKSCNVGVGVVVENDTDSSAGVTVSVTENEIVCTLSGGTNNTWTKDDTYYIYKTATKDSFISSIDTDRRAGRKVYIGDSLTRHGNRPEDEDLDEDNQDIFAPGQPERSHS